MNNLHDEKKLLMKKIKDLKRKIKATNQRERNEFEISLRKNSKGRVLKEPKIKNYLQIKSILFKTEQDH